MEMDKELDQKLEDAVWAARSLLNGEKHLVLPQI